MQLLLSLGLLPSILTEFFYVVTGDIGSCAVACSGIDHWVGFELGHKAKPAFF